MASAVQAIALQSDGRILLAGNFTTFNSQNFNRIVRLRNEVQQGEASIDVQWLRGVEGTPTAGGTVAMVMLLVVAAACVGRAWRLAAKPPCD